MMKKINWQYRLNMLILFVIWGLFPQTIFGGTITINHLKSFTLRQPIQTWSEIRNRYLIKQQFETSCGPASLATLLTFFFNQPTKEEEIITSILQSQNILPSDIKSLENKEVMEELLQKLKVQSIAISFQDMKTYAEQRGYIVQGLALPLDSLKKLKAPVIVNVKIRYNEHFSVYKGMDDRYVYLADPALGNVKISLAKFQEMFYTRKDMEYPGKVLALIPQDAQKQAEVNQQFMKLPEESGFVYKLIQIRMMSLR